MNPGGTGLIDAVIRLLDGKVIAALVAGFLVSAIVGVILARRTKVSPMLTVLTVFSAVAVAVATLQMGRAGGGVLDRDPLEHISFGALGRCFAVADGGSLVSSNEASLNLLLYVPFGVFATLAFGRPSRVMAWSIALILAMEALQSVLDVGVCSVLDVAYNIAGVALAIVATVAAQWSALYLSERNRPSEPR